MYLRVLETVEKPTDALVHPDAWDGLLLTNKKLFARWAYYCVSPMEYNHIRIVDGRTGRKIASWNPAFGYDPDP